MDLVAYFLVFLAVCVVWFLITRLWVAGIDAIISLFKKMFGLNKSEPTKNWHTLEDLQKKNDKNNPLG
ncbi:hypothetical protein [Atopobium fossor]|uniref:hypothetical protein n=1 Tax=Atopobium fossor TaxID=39487 RepID=UPI000481F742|nr:hypothetical protein [Atopobium fossor]